MKIIAMEEHVSNAAIEAAVRKSLSTGQQEFKGRTLPDRLVSQLEDMGTDRLQHMDATGIDVQVLSYTAPGVQVLPAAEAIPLARDANDQLAAAIAAHPERFAGFATLPTPDPEAAALEFERAVLKLGLKGALINGPTNERFLDDPSFRPLLQVADTLRVPIYIHPTPPPLAVQQAYYTGFEPAVSTFFARAGWGWHMEAGIHALRLILGGAFDRYPNLQVILGHWGEMIPFYLDRVNQVLNPGHATLAASRRGLLLATDVYHSQRYVYVASLSTGAPGHGRGSHSVLCRLSVYHGRASQNLSRNSAHQPSR